MRHVSMISCLATAGLVVYGAVGLAGLAAGVSVRASHSAAPNSVTPETIAAGDVIAARFPVPAPRDVAPAQAAMLRAAALRTDEIVTLSARTLRSAALRYGILESALRPSELAPAGTTDASTASSSALANADGTAPWHEAFIARILTADQAANFAILPGARTIAMVEGADASEPAASGAADTDAKPSAPTPLPVAAPRRRGLPGGVLNEAQIASIKSRLNLTPEQERMWPAVEAALRNISYSKTALAQARTGSRMAFVDSNGPEVQQLKYAALPLIMQLSDDQKREVKSLVHVMGLDEIINGVTGWF